MHGNQESTEGSAPHGETGPVTAQPVSECQRSKEDTKQVADTLTSTFRGYFGEHGTSAVHEQPEASQPVTSATGEVSWQQSSHQPIPNATPRGG